MKHPRRGLAALALAIAATATPLAAHHSTAMFQWGKEVTMTGATVERWDWTNPHTFLYVAVQRGGATEHWAFEGMSPNHLSRIGWSRHSLMPGQKISLAYYPLKDARKGGFNVAVTLPNGQTLRQLENPNDRPDKPGS